MESTLQESPLYMFINIGKLSTHLSFFMSEELVYAKECWALSINICP